MIMVRLAKEVNETIRLAVLEGAEARFCAEAGVARPGLRMLGAMVDAHASAAGKALIAWRLARRHRIALSRPQHARLLRAHHPQRTDAGGRACGSARARLGRQRGRRPRPDDRGLAVPCFDSNGHVRFSLAIASTRKRLPPSRDKACLSRLITAAREMSDALGLSARTGRRSASPTMPSVAANYCPTLEPARREPTPADAHSETSQA